MVSTKIKVRKYIGTLAYFTAVGIMMFMTLFYFENNGYLEKRSLSGSSGYMHIVTASDVHFFPGIPALINSVRRTSKFPSRIKFHIVVCGDADDIVNLREYLQCYGIDKYDENIEVLSFQTYQALDEDTRYAWDDMFRNRRLRSDCNYARTYIHRLLPDIKRIIYLDVDVVTKEPIENLWKIASRYHSPLLAVDNNKTYIDDGFEIEAVSKLYHKRYGREFSPSSLVFNGGVLVIDLDFYRKYDIEGEIEYFVHEYSKAPVRLWRFDCQSIFQLVYHELWVKLDHKWNCRGLGRDHPRASESIESGSILHWSASNKPWTGEGPHVELWKTFRPPQCSNHGYCQNNTNAIGQGYWYCVCDSNYMGDYCQFPNRGVH